MSRHREPAIDSDALDAIALAGHLSSIVEAQEQIWQQAAARGQGPDVSVAQLEDLDIEFRQVVRNLGAVIQAPFPTSRFYGWAWQAAAWAPERVARSTGRKRARIDALVAQLTGAPRWELIPFADEQASFMGDTRKLDVPEFDALEAALDRVLAVHGSALIGTKWIHKTVDSDGIYEFRIDNDLEQIERRTEEWASGEDDDLDDDEAEERVDEVDEQDDRGEDTDVLLRVFFMFDGSRVIVLFHVYDKGGDDSRKRENRAIAEAKARMTRYRLKKGRS